MIRQDFHSFTRAHPPRTPRVRQKSPRRGGTDVSVEAPTRPRWVVVIEPEPGDPRPLAIPVRLLLKRLLKQLGLRCIEVREVVVGTVDSENANRPVACESCTRTMGTTPGKDP